ncbi:putative ribose-phosphate pyrophosphokinase [Pseudomonas phage PAK_P1]|uniref:ribose-phosphate diphosphokinase n=1 Tax=Pseudomonas phage PAK_P1 TaxID=743813 RepID=D4N406_9CAUD|nr:ribose-phosphate pyrophosphokinase [Pseudomonas phage PAK_P1]ADD64976.1 putative ribose-phosphate pyrophosphokinase [Pseudomonas phage PAK_P1]
MISYVTGCLATIEEPGFALPMKEAKVWTFPGGEVGVNVSGIDASAGSFVNVKAQIQNSDDILALLNVTEAIRAAMGRPHMTLLLGYVPYARQDRRCNPGDAFSLKVFANLINSAGYDRVIVVDPHSETTLHLINNVEVVSQASVFGGLLDRSDWEQYQLVAPDIGATKRTEQFAKETGAGVIIRCNKKRDLKTGKIEGFEILNPSDINPELPLLVLDDICDGGATFRSVAKALRGYSEVLPDLFVTHGIFSKGVDCLLDDFGCIYTSDTLPQENHPELMVVPVKYSRAEKL